ncbi:MULTISPECIES: hypothetical protein [unclassified Colwellia]|jgi:hypothetical protein|uniref:hypothetical protein n=1 Tax=unclassified Colwellia TaxID=196834 RepID=UPI0015F3AAA6|nr:MULTISPECIES: hypothetical protein [unclassified Colwellia]MBA6336736.1 hypothetical protein [Colwellia sp. BRX8-7]MBA6378728.1 hypothetical protein [Colwellia sp. BRX10-7]MBA6387417.1 hypothetical protein [Colwellia sp. BRX10-2]MBA6401370.1 hypothetical protein [Colwellia sp. BRX10-5]MBA6404396.1 hypothetical protein [Colwellia sp. BRX10-1]
MTLQQVSAKKGKSLAENLIILAMIGLLMATFLYYFFKQEQHLSRVGFDSVANTFSARVIGIHAQWFMDNKPSWVLIKEATAVNGDRENNRIAVNKLGWVDIATVNSLSNENECQKIWQQVLATPMIYIKQPISAVIVNIKTNQVGQQQKYLCQYSLPSGEYFEYHPSNGKVTEIKIH